MCMCIGCCSFGGLLAKGVHVLLMQVCAHVHVQQRHTWARAHLPGCRLAYVTARLPVDLGPSAVPNMGETQKKPSLPATGTTHTQRGDRTGPAASPREASRV